MNRKATRIKKIIRTVKRLGGMYVVDIKQYEDYDDAGELRNEIVVDLSDEINSTNLMHEVVRYAPPVAAYAAAKRITFVV